MYNAVFILREDMDMIPPKAKDFVASCLHQANIANTFVSNAIVMRKLKIINSATNGGQQLFSDNNKVSSVFDCILSR